MKNQKHFLRAFILITSLFFLWALAHNLNDILIKQFQKALSLSRGQSGFIQFAFYLGYFLMALPAGMVMKRMGYKKGIIFGLFLYAIGAFLFYPAAEVREYSFFLIALFIIASGLTFLETAANPYITVLGDPDKSEQRLNLAQAFNGLGAVVGPVIGGIFIFSGNEMSQEQLAQLPQQELDAFHTAEANAVQMPYLVIGIVVLLVALLIYKTQMPKVEEDDSNDNGFKINPKLFKTKHLVWGIVAQFFYVGAQVSIWSYFIDFVLSQSQQATEKEAAFLLSTSLFLFMCGRFIGTFLMRYIAANKLMGIYAIINIVLILGSIVLTGMPAIYCLMSVSFFMSIMFPTIFALSVKGLGDDTKIASSLIIMTIVGGAVLPPLMGYMADWITIEKSLFLPMVCFAVIITFAFYGYKPLGKVQDT